MTTEPIIDRHDNLLKVLITAGLHPAWLPVVERIQDRAGRCAKHSWNLQKIYIELATLRKLRESVLLAIDPSGCALVHDDYMRILDTVLTAEYTQAVSPNKNAKFRAELERLHEDIEVPRAQLPVDENGEAVAPHSLIGQQFSLWLHNQECFNTEELLADLKALPLLTPGVAFDTAPSLRSSILQDLLVAGWTPSNPRRYRAARDAAVQ